MRYSGFDYAGRPESRRRQPATDRQRLAGVLPALEGPDARRAVLGAFANACAISDHLFDVHAFTDSAFKGDVPILTIPGASCPGQNTLVASHPDSTPALNTGNGSTYDDTSGVTMGMGETMGLAAWWQRNRTWPTARTASGSSTPRRSASTAPTTTPPTSSHQARRASTCSWPTWTRTGWSTPPIRSGARTRPTTRARGTRHQRVADQGLLAVGLQRRQEPARPERGDQGEHGQDRRFRAALADSVRQAFIDQGAKYAGKVPLADGTTAKVYSPGDIPGKSPVQDDVLGRTDQVPFVAQGIPGFGVLGAYDSEPNQNPAAGLGRWRRSATARCSRSRSRPGTTPRATTSPTSTR